MFLEDIRNACDAVADAVVAGCSAIQRAWDNLDPGLKQWIVMGVSMAVSFILAGGRRKKKSGLTASLELSCAN